MTTLLEDPTQPLEEEKQLNNTVNDKPWQWKPGQTGNPHGRPPKGHSITETIRAMMDSKPEIKVALGNKILQMALNGDMTAIKTIWSYFDGMPSQTTILKGDVNEPIAIKLD